MYVVNDLNEPLLGRPAIEKFNLLKKINNVTQTGSVTYGDKIKEVILYGSYARGEATEESDVDILVVVDDSLDQWEVWDYLIPRLADFLEMGFDVNAIVVGYKEWKEGSSAFYQNVRRDGIRI